MVAVERTSREKRVGHMDEAARVLQHYVGAWNDQDGEGLAALYHQDAERASPLGTARGSKAIREAAMRLWRAAPDSRIAITHWAASGSIVLYEFTDEGTHTGPLATPSSEVMGSGRQFRIEGAGVLELHEGRIAAERIYLDAGQFLRQLGLS
jgi:steroid delta-isomerase-like uncharacterized protein